jgi:hypothetical protein
MASSTPPERLVEPSTSLSKVVKRDIHVLLVAADLLGQGFAVFHKLGRASPCEFVIVQGRQCWRVTVRTARYSDRPYSRGRPAPWVPQDAERFDVVAYVLPNGVIRYEPPLERLHGPDPGAVTP